MVKKQWYIIVLVNKIKHTTKDIQLVMKQSNFDTDPSMWPTLAKETINEKIVYFCTLILSAEDGLRCLTAWGKTLLCSLLVRQQILLWCQKRAKQLACNTYYWPCNKDTYCCWLIIKKMLIDCYRDTKPISCRITWNLGLWLVLKSLEN